MRYPTRHKFNRFRKAGQNVSAVQRCQYRRGVCGACGGQGVVTDTGRCPHCEGRALLAGMGLRPTLFEELLRELQADREVA